MSSAELARLAAIGQLEPEPPNDAETTGLIRSARARLADARNPTLSLESRFDLAYNAAHALSLAALRRAGYRSQNRFVVFQALAHTLAIPVSTWRLLAKCHEMRNRAEYGGVTEINERLVGDLIAAADVVESAL